jgi:hypothetical protein
MHDSNASEKRRDVAKYCVSVLLELFNTFVNDAIVGE